MSGAQYEFSGDQNRIIGNLAGKMSVVGLFLILIGLGVAIMAVVGFLPLLGEMPSIPDAVAPEVRDAFLQYTTYAKGNREQLYFGTLAGALQAARPPGVVDLVRGRQQPSDEARMAPVRGHRDGR